LLDDKYLGYDMTAIELLKASKISMLDKNRKLALMREAARCQSLDGDFAEFGVFAGGSAVLLGHIAACAGKHLHLFDTWEGYPRVSKSDPPRIQVGQCCVKKRVVERTLSMNGIRNYTLYKGSFCDTLSSFRHPLAFAHIDCDLYEGTKQCLICVLPLMHPNGSLIVDDYCERWKGVVIAVEECAGGWQKLVVDGSPDRSVILFRQ
jgi:hypothetical protein